jgi:hypothetical protein
MIFNYVVVFLIGLAIGVSFMAWWKDRKHPIQSGKITAPKPWPLCTIMIEKNKRERYDLGKTVYREN